MHLFEMKKDRQTALDAADAILARAENAKREMNAQETALFDEHMGTVKKLTAKIEPIETNNTLLPLLRQNPAALLVEV